MSRRPWKRKFFSALFSVRLLSLPHGVRAKNVVQFCFSSFLFSANDFASSQETSKNEPDLSYLPRLRPAVTMMHLMVMCINTVLLPLAASNLGIRREMEKRTNAAVSGMEEKINSIMQHTVDAVLGWTNKLLQSQKKSDFRPKDAALEGGGGWLAMSQTAVRFCLFFYLTTYN